MHFDSAHNVLVQAAGAKRVWLVPPAASTQLALYPSVAPGARSSAAVPAGAGGGGGVRLDGLRPGDHQSSMAAVVRRHPGARVFELKVGDALYIPPYWHHHVCVSGGAPSLSFSLWMRSAEGAALKQLLALRVPFAPEWDPGERLSSVFFLLNAVAPPGAAAAAALRAEVASRYDAALSVDYGARPLPAKLAGVLCGIGQSAAALAHLWPGCATIACIRGHASAAAFVAAAGGLLAVAARAPGTLAIHAADVAEAWILQTLAVVEPGPAARARGWLLPHIVAQCGRHFTMAPS